MLPDFIIFIVIVCNLFGTMLINAHGSYPYNKIDLTIDLNISIFVLIVSMLVRYLM